MFNRGGVTKVEATTPNQILLFTQPYAAISVLLGMDYITPIVNEVDGRKIALAGSPIAFFQDIRNGSPTSYRMAKFLGTEMLQEIAGGARENYVCGVLAHDVDVTNGSTANAAMILFGFVNAKRLHQRAKFAVTESEVQKLLDGKIWVTTE